MTFFHKETTQINNLLNELIKYLKSFRNFLKRYSYGFISFLEICMEVFPIKLILVSSIFINIIVVISFFFFDFNTTLIDLFSKEDLSSFEFSVFQSSLNKKFLGFNQFFFFSFFGIHCLLGFLNFLYDYIYKNLKLTHKDKLLYLFFLTFFILFLVLKFFL
jgi:hypothetical protein